jgi:predicted PurR-regulated permease PerM
MWSTLKSIFVTIQALFSLLRQWQEYQAALAKARDEKYRKELKDALEKLKNAKTDDEIFEAQSRVAKSKQ